ncbi:tartan [Culex quinquefasciatus]|uniref:Tartan n=1 Tax=Culex quinquefasciatus TaxID=7176 RepID=B0WBS6_CULQU|nr:tartan [Culex quinquefasciatus]|eukprot:XP_001846160.1 tartan [Culex quinquefasciatus]
MAKVMLLTFLGVLLQHCQALTISPQEINKVLTATGYPQLDAATSSVIATDRNEAAMFLAQVIHESGGFRYREEIGGQRQYYGRGYIQLTWDYNYRAASADLFGDDRLMRNLGVVSQTPQLSMAVSVWFWTKNVRPAGPFFSKTMTLILSWLFILALIVPDLSSSLLHCPSRCHCDDEKLDVNCEEGHLDVVPIALNPSIQRLVIRNNKIRIIDSSVQFYSELTLLDLSYNYLFNIPDRTFARQSKLQQLHLNHNKISAVSNRTFVGLGELLVLNLRGNLIDQIEPLEELSIGQNYFEALGGNAFRGLSNLKRFELRGSLYLKRIERAAFQTNTNLESIAIESNKALSELEEETFAGLLFLKHLSLRNNGFTQLDEGMFSWNSLRSLDISDNPINCDCYYSRLLHRLQTANRIMYNATGCPHYLPDQFECEYALQKNKNFISVLVLAVALMTAIVICLYKFRDLLRTYVHNGCKNKPTSAGSTAGSLDVVDYEKAFTGDDRHNNLYSNHQVQPILTGYPTAAAAYMQATSAGYNPYYNAKPLPITEL